MSKKMFTVYAIINAMYDKGILTSDFDVDYEKHVVTDNNRLRTLFCLQSDEMFDVNNAKRASEANKNVYRNYVRIESDDDSSLIQLWGKPKRNDVIIEFRQKLFDKLALEKVACIKNCKHEEYKHKLENRLCVVDNEKDAIKIIEAFLKALDATKNNTSATKRSEAKKNEA